MTRPPFLHSGAVGHLRAAGVHALAVLRHLGWALRIVLGHGLAAIVALIVVFEEWGWRPLANALARLARLRPFAMLEAWIASLPPYGALAVFALPSLLILPLKLVALVLITAGHKLSAALLFVGAKIVGTALVARIFMLTQAALMRIPWFKRGYDILMPMKEALVAWVHDSAAWKVGRIAKARAKRALAPAVAAIRARITAIRIRLLGR